MLKVANSVINASQITGVLPVLNGGTGVTTSTGTGNTVLSASPTLSGDVNLSTGNLVIGTNGKGIDFSITSHPAGMTSELLSDYEEGTWTPALNSFTIVGTATVSGIYTKIGKFVKCTANIKSSTTIAAIAATSSITGLPYNQVASFGSSSQAMNIDTAISYGTGNVQGSFVYVPSWSATGNQLSVDIIYTV